MARALEHSRARQNVISSSFQYFLLEIDEKQAFWERLYFWRAMSVPKRVLWISMGSLRKADAICTNLELHSSNNCENSFLWSQLWNSRFSKFKKFIFKKVDFPRCLFRHHMVNECCLKGIMHWLLKSTDESLQIKKSVFWSSNVDQKVTD